MNNSLLILLLLFIILIIIIGLILYFSSLRKFLSTRNLSSILQLKKSIGNTVEDGKSVHLSIGKSDLANFHGAASFIGLETTNKIISQITLSDNPPTVTSGSGDVTLLSQTAAYDSMGSKSRISQTSLPDAYLSGASNLAYIAGAIPPAAEKGLSSQVFVGNFGPEIGLVLHESNQKNHFSLSATDNLEGQSVSYVCANEPILGDQIFSIPSELSKDTKNQISVILHDTLRWVIILVIILLVLLKLTGIL